MAVKDLSKARLHAFKRLIKQAGLDGYFTAAPLEMRYLSGVELSEGEAVLLVTLGKTYFFTRTMIVPKMAGVRSFIKVQDVSLGTLTDAALQAARTAGLKTVGFAQDKVNFLLGRRLEQAGCVSAGALMDEMRLTKYPDEIAKLQTACRIASEAFKEVKPQIKTGMTEQAVAALLAGAMFRRGAEAIPFNIVCFGENTADAHHTASKTRKLKKNEAILMDFGCQYEGYCSDMTRSWWHGDNPPAQYEQIWNITHAAYRACAKSLRAGLSCREADAAARRIIEDAGFGKEFFHSVGHGVGLLVHDGPLLGPRSVQELEENSPVTVEPGIYLAGKWGVRLEDTYLVTAGGSKKLTKN